MLTVNAACIHSRKGEHFLRWPWTSTHELDLWHIYRQCQGEPARQMSRSKSLRWRSFFGHTDTHTYTCNVPITLCGPRKWSVTKQGLDCMGWTCPPILLLHLVIDVQTQTCSLPLKMYTTTHIRGFTTMRYINLRFTYLLTYFTSFYLPLGIL